MASQQNPSTVPRPQAQTPVSLAHSRRPSDGSLNSISATQKKKGKAPAVPSHPSSQTPHGSSLTKSSEVNRPCQEHFFLTDVADVRQMEKNLLVLLEDFHNGKLQVFGKGCTFEQMDLVREKQESLSRLHFDLDAQQQLQRDGEDSKDITIKNLNKLVENLEDLSQAVHGLKGSTLPPKSAGRTSKPSTEQK